MNIIVVGGGRTGSLLARRLIKRNHDVVVVEMDEERAHDLATEIDGLVIHGSGSDLDVLEDAGAEDADALAAVSGADEINFMACKLAKKLDIPRVVTRVNDEEHASMFEDSGADAAISFVDAAVTLYEKAVTGSDMYGLFSLTDGEGEVVGVTVSEDSEAVKSTIRDLSLPDLCTISMISRDGALIPPRGDTELMEGDRIILAGKFEDVMEVAKLFRGV